MYDNELVSDFLKKKDFPSILIVEDDVSLAQTLSDTLKDEGMEAHVCLRASDVIDFFEKNKHADLILLDIALPDLDGISLLRILRKELNFTPVIFLTATDAESKKIEGLNTGGDDYIIKPFSTEELIARISAVLRRTEIGQDHKLTTHTKYTEKSFNFCNAMVNPNRLEILFPDGKTQKIGKKELGIFICLLESHGKVLSRRLLMRKVWGMKANYRSRSLDQYIVKIRDLLQSHGCDTSPLKTVHGVGFLYDLEEIKVSE